MAVIYEDQTSVGSGGLAQALGMAAGNAIYGEIDKHYTAKYLQQAAGMNPEQRTAFLTEKLGPKGTALAEQLTQADLDTANLNLVHLKNVDQQYLNTIDQVNATNAPTMAKLAITTQQATIAETNARTIADRAGSVADYASANAANAQAGYYQSEAAIDQQRFNLMAGTVQAIHAYMTDPQNAPNLLSQDPNFPGGATGKPLPHVNGAPSLVTDPTTAVNQGKTLIGMQIGTMSQADLNAAFPPDVVTPGTTKGMAMTALGYLSQGDMGEAMKSVDATTPTSVTPTERAPGVYQNFATYQDGTGAWVGSPRLQLKPAPTQFLEVNDGLSAWQATTGALNVLSQQNLGNRGTRQAAAMLTGLGIDVSQIGGDQAALYQTALAHAVIAATNIAGASGSRSQKIIQQIQNTLPKYTDAPDIKAAKLNAAGALLDSLVKPLVGGLVSSGYAIPPDMAGYYRSRGLDSKSITQLEGDYLKGMGAPLPAPDGDPLDAGDDSVNSPPGGPDAAGGTPDGGASAPPSTVSPIGSNSPPNPDPNAGWSITPMPSGAQ